jgi:hypothetical protein
MQWYEIEVLILEMAVPLNAVLLLFPGCDYMRRVCARGGGDLTTLAVARLVSNGNRLMDELSGKDSERSNRSFIKVLSQHLLGGTEENNKKSESF